MTKLIIWLSNRVYQCKKNIILKFSSVLKEKSATFAIEREQKRKLRNLKTD